jgi:hypothetical protein
MLDHRGAPARFRPAAGRTLRDEQSGQSAGGMARPESRCKPVRGF